MKKQVPDLQSNDEKIAARYMFACIAGILYIAPCMMCLAFGVMTEGFSAKFIAAFITAALALPVSLMGLSCYKRHKGRTLLTACVFVQIAAHLVTAFLITTWYLILAPALVLSLILLASVKAV